MAFFPGNKRSLGSGCALGIERCWRAESEKDSVHGWKSPWIGVPFRMGEKAPQSLPPT